MQSIDSQPLHKGRDLPTLIPSNAASRTASRRRSARLHWLCMVCFLLLLTTSAATISAAQTVATLYHFDGSMGSRPIGTLVQGLDGNFYGVTSNGGSIFRISPKGVFTQIYKFCSQLNCADGTAASSGLTLATYGNFYGTTQDGGMRGSPYCSLFGCGTIFKITPDGTLTTLYKFCSKANCIDGVVPSGGVVQGPYGFFYGTTLYGGRNPTFANGTVFKFNPNGVLTTLYNFCHTSSPCTDGAFPSSPLVQDIQGNFYGTTLDGGADSGSGTDRGGTVFKITQQGKVTTLYSFCQGTCLGRVGPSNLSQDSEGNLYGAASFSPEQADSIFKITPQGSLTILYTFCAQPNCADGDGPRAGLIFANDGNLYGTNSSGGAKGDGTVFQLTPEGTLSVFYAFNSMGQYGPMLQMPDGKIYWNYAGCLNSCTGGILRLNNNLSPFVETMPSSGAHGAAITILGVSLTGAIDVSFAGTTAKFTVVSDSEIQATVPKGAITGTVSVTTPKATFSSNTAFQVKP